MRAFRGSSARYTSAAAARAPRGAASEKATSDHILISSRGVTMPTSGAVAGSTAPDWGASPPVRRRWFPRPASSSARSPTSLASTPRPPESLIIGPYTLLSCVYSALTGECDMEETATFAGTSAAVSAPALSLVSTTWHDDAVSKDTTLDDTRLEPETVAWNTIVVWSSRKARIAPEASDASCMKSSSLADAVATASSTVLMTNSFRTSSAIARGVRRSPHDPSTRVDRTRPRADFDSLGRLELF